MTSAPGIRRLAGSRGESLVETLVAVLVSALSLLVLATVLGVSFNLVSRSRESMGGYYRQDARVAAHDGPDATGTVSLTGTGLGAGVSASVDFFVNDAGTTRVIGYGARG